MKKHSWHLAQALSFQHHWVGKSSFSGRQQAWLLMTFGCSGLQRTSNLSIPAPFDPLLQTPSSPLLNLYQIIAVFLGRFKNFQYYVVYINQKPNVFHSLDFLPLPSWGSETWINSHRISIMANLAPEQITVNAIACFSFQILHISPCGGQRISVEKGKLCLHSSIPSCKNDHVLQSPLVLLSLLLQD